MLGHQSAGKNHQTGGRKRFRLRANAEEEELSFTMEGPDWVNLGWWKGSCSGTPQQGGWSFTSGASVWISTRREDVMRPKVSIAPWCMAAVQVLNPSSSVSLRSQVRPQSSGGMSRLTAKLCYLLVVIIGDHLPGRCCADSGAKSRHEHKMAALAS